MSDLRSAMAARGLPSPINGTEQYLEALVFTLGEVLEEFRALRAPAVDLDVIEVEPGRFIRVEDLKNILDRVEEPGMDLTEPAKPADTDESIELAEPASVTMAPLEITEPAPPAKKAAAKKAPAKRASAKK
jgi:hypothetical protein